MSYITPAKLKTFKTLQDKFNENKFSQEDTKIKNSIGTVPDGKTVEGQITDLETLVGTTAVDTQISTAVANATDSNSTLGKAVTANTNNIATIQGDADTTGSINKALADAKAYTDTKDTAMDARVDALEATHATTDAGAFKTVAAEAEAAADAAVAKLTANAPDTFDTFKELADWIQGEGESAFKAASRIQALETSVTAINGDKDTTGSFAKAIADEDTAIKAILGADFSSSATVSAAVASNDTDITNLTNALGYTDGKLAAAGQEAKTVKARLDEAEASITKLDGAVNVEGSVKKQINDAITDLDATVGSTTVEANKNVAVQVTEVDGKLTSLTITQSDIASASALTNLATAVGISTLAEGTSSVVARVAALESKTGTGDVSTQITNAIADLDADVSSSDLSEAASATFADGATTADATEAEIKVKAQIVETDGELESVTITTTDIASAVVLAQEIQERKNAIAAITSISDDTIKALF